MDMVLLRMVVHVQNVLQMMLFHAIMPVVFRCLSVRMDCLQEVFLLLALPQRELMYVLLLVASCAITLTLLKRILGNAYVANPDIT